MKEKAAKGPIQQGAQKSHKETTTGIASPKEAKEIVAINEPSAGLFRTGFG